MTLIIPAVIWSSATATLHDCPHDRERALFLDGPRPAEGAPAVATTLVLPHITHSRGHYEITPGDMSRAGRHLRELGLIRLAQMHSHPGGGTGHSEHDDAMAFSRRDGAISIVVPHYGACAPGLADCGIHSCQDGEWQEIGVTAVARYVQVVPSVLDFRA